MSELTKEEIESFLNKAVENIQNSGPFEGAAIISQEWFEGQYRSAYERGRADAMKELMEGEPDGWCGLNKYGDYLLASNDLDNVEVYTRKFELEEVLNTFKLNKDDGWQIVPVKLLKMELDKGVSAGEG